MGPWGKQLEFIHYGPILQDQNNRLGPAQIEDKRPHIPHSQSQQTPPTTHAQKGSLEVKRGVMLSG